MNMTQSNYDNSNVDSNHLEYENNGRSYIQLESSSKSGSTQKENYQTIDNQTTIFNNIRFGNYCDSEQPVAGSFLIEQQQQQLRENLSTPTVYLLDENKTPDLELSYGYPLNFDIEKRNSLTIDEVGEFLEEIKIHHPSDDNYRHYSTVTTNCPPSDLIVSRKETVNNNVGRQEFHHNSNQNIIISEEEFNNNRQNILDNCIKLREECSEEVLDVNLNQNSETLDNNNYQEDFAQPIFIFQNQNIHLDRNLQASSSSFQDQMIMIDNNNEPKVEIIEQPAKCNLRFRYKCEGRSAGSLPGVSSSSENKTYPTIKISNYTGKAVVVISCVTKDEPYLVHPHNIVGKEGCKDDKGICSIPIDCETNVTIRSFPSIGIQCVKKREIEESLTKREKLRIDPFRNGFSHKTNPSNIDLNVVRLCFQVFIEGSKPRLYNRDLPPVVSTPVHDKKAMSDLVICEMSHHAAPATGGRRVILLCDRICKDDIQIRFFEGDERNPDWESFTEVHPTMVHKQYAIIFFTPKYKDENIQHPVMCKIQLIRISDRENSSRPLSFQFIPCESDDDIIMRKRKKCQKLNSLYGANVLPQLQLQQNQNQQQQGRSPFPQPTRPLISSNQPQHLQPQPGPSYMYNPPLDNLQHSTLQMTKHSATHDQQQSQHHSLTPNASPSPIIINNNANSPFSQQQQQELLLCTGRRVAPTGSKAQSSSNSPTNNNNDIDNNHASRNNNQTNTQGRFMLQDQNIVVRGQIVDNQGNIMRLVERPTNQQIDNANGLNNINLQLASSLDRIDTTELMRDIDFNSNMDINLGSMQSLATAAASGQSEIKTLYHRQ